MKKNNEQDESVHNILRNNEINLTLRRTFGEEKHEDPWQQLNSQTRNIHLNTETDTLIRWALEKNDNFTTASLYKELFFLGLENMAGDHVYLESKNTKQNQDFLVVNLHRLFTICITTNQEECPGDIHYTNSAAKLKQHNTIFSHAI